MPARGQPTAHADVAQLVERWLPKPKVAGSRPVVRFHESPANAGLAAATAFIIALVMTVVVIAYSHGGGGSQAYGY